MPGDMVNQTTLVATSTVWIVVVVVIIVAAAFVLISLGMRPKKVAAPVETRPQRIPMFPTAQPNPATEQSENVRALAWDPTGYSADASQQTAAFLREGAAAAMAPVDDDTVANALSALQATEAPEMWFLDGAFSYRAAAWDGAMIIERFGPGTAVEAAVWRDARPDLQRGFPVRELQLLVDGAKLNDIAEFNEISAPESAAFEETMSGMSRIDDLVLAVAEQPGFAETAGRNLDEWVAANVREIPA